MDISPYRVAFDRLLLPEIISVPIVAVAISVLYWGITRTPFRAALGITICFGILGGTCGVISGETFEPIIGALLTSLLGLVSAILSLAFAKTAATAGPNSSGDNFQLFVGPAIVTLCLSALIGLEIGRVYQTDWVNYDRKYAETKDLNERVHMPVARVMEQYKFCRETLKSVKFCDAILLHTD